MGAARRPGAELDAVPRRIPAGVPLPLTVPWRRWSDSADAHRGLAGPEHTSAPGDHRRTGPGGVGNVEALAEARSPRASRGPPMRAPSFWVEHGWLGGDRGHAFDGPRPAAGGARHHRSRSAGEVSGRPARSVPSRYRWNGLLR